MKIEYALTLADYKAALALHNRQKVLGSSSNFVVLRIVPAISVLAITFWLVEAALGKSSLDETQPLTWIFCVFFVTLPALYEWQIRKCFNQLFPSSVAGRIVSFSADDNLIISSIPGVNEGRFYWNSIDHFAQDEKVTLIYVAKRRFMFLPTRAFSPKQRTELNDVVARHGVRVFAC